MNANTQQVAGNHYKTASGFQHWDMVVEQQLNYFEGQITKYVMRARKKNGMEDLKKASHFLEKYMEVFDSYYTPRVVESCVQKGRPELFTVEEYVADGPCLYKCTQCGGTVRATSWATAATQHGNCAGKGYVAQG